VKQGENERSSLSLANESQFLLITRSSISELLTNVEPNLDLLLVSLSSLIVEHLALFFASQYPFTRQNMVLAGLLAKLD